MVLIPQLYWLSLRGIFNYFVEYLFLKSGLTLEQAKQKVQAREFWNGSVDVQHSLE